MNTPTIPEWRASAPAGVSLSQAMTRSGPMAAAPRMLRRPNADLSRILLPPAYGRWHSQQLEYYTPQQVGYVLQYGLGGDIQGQWALFDLMEDTWPRLAKNLAEIKRSVQSMRWTVKPWAEDDAPPTPEAEERAKLVSNVLWNMHPSPDGDEQDLPGMMYDLLDAWAKGLSVCELMWEQRPTWSMGDILALRSAQWVHPDFYAFGQDGRLGLRTQMSISTTSVVYSATSELPSYKFVVASAKGRTTHMSAAAMLRPLAWWWAASNFAANWLLNYAQLFGIPMRWATYSQSASEELVAKIGEKMAEMGSAAWATFPEGTAMQILEASKAAGASPQESVIDRADKYCDLLVLGQTLTSDAADKGTQALGTVHERIRGDVVQSAADWLAGILQHQVAQAAIELNYGDSDLVPEIRVEPVRSKDYMANAQRDATLLGAGLELPKAWLYERHEIPMPKEGEETVSSAPAPDPNSPFAIRHSPLPGMPQDDSEESDGDKIPPEARKSNLPHGGTRRKASYSAGMTAAAAKNVNPAPSDPDQAQKTIDDVVRLAVADAAGVRLRWLTPVKTALDRLIQAARDESMSDAALVEFIEDATRSMPELFAKLDKAALAESLEAAMGAAALEGVKERVGK